METNPSLMLLIWFLVLGLASSSYISNHAMDLDGSIGRHLLQAKGSCPINFEEQNYTIITSQCKGPNYNQKLCCDAFRQFSCPYADQVNDLKTGCAETMFTYINIYGKYPPGLFVNLCKDDIEGIVCKPEDFNKAAQKSGAILATAAKSSPLFIFSAAFLMILCNW